MDNSSTKKEFGNRVFVGIQSQALCFQFLERKMGSGDVRSQAFLCWWFKVLQKGGSALGEYQGLGKDRIDHSVPF